jgi:nitroimidazol reductase NimA-like FMN-containing flavoprotein (pyridoxamine 5'-phosphate oxidase superfamily)
MKKELEQTDRTKLKRLPKRGNFDRETIHSILDEGFICHVGFTVGGQTFVIPTSYGRDGDKIYIHGASVSRMMKNLAEGIEICVTVTLLDGLVLARSVFNHSMNYRSVVIFGKAEVIEKTEEKMKALHTFTEKLIPGRWDDSRIPNEKELNVTTVLSLPIDEASAKIRTGDPSDDAKDYELDYWAGVLPLKLKAGEPIDDTKLKSGIEQPGYLSDIERFRG